jgi:hypothetical protein
MKVGDKVRVTKGCRHLSIVKGQSATILEVVDLGPEYSHMGDVRLEFALGRKLTLSCRFFKWLEKSEARLRSGRVEEFIEVRVIP